MTVLCSVTVLLCVNLIILINCIQHCQLTSNNEVPGIFIPTVPSSSSSSSIAPSSVSTTSSTPARSPSISSTTSSSTTTMPSDVPPAGIDDGLSYAVCTGISIAITVPVTAVITAIITVIILYLCGYKKVSKESKTTPPHEDYEIPIGTNDVEMKGNTAYGQVKHTTDNPTTVTTSGAAYESMYM